MNPLRIVAENYRTFERLELDLPEGCTAVIGENGAGKSSIVNIIDLTLFGPDARSLAPYLTDGGDETELLLELEFEHRDERYRVRRGFSARGRGKTTLDLESHVEGPGDVGGATIGSWQSLTRGSVKETEEALVAILGFTRDTFRASAFLAQGDGAAFPEADPRRRKQLLADVLGLNRYDTLLAAVRVDRRQVDDELQRIAGRLEQADAELAQRDSVERALAVAGDTVTAAETAVTAAEQRVTELAGQRTTVERQQTELRDARAERDRAEDQARAARTRLQEAVDAAAQVQVAADELAALPTAEQVAALEQREAELGDRLVAYQHALAEHETARREREMKEAQRTAIERQAVDLHREAGELRVKADQLEQHAAAHAEAKCETCGQSLNAEARATSIATWRIRADELDAAAKDLDVQAQAVELPQVPAKPAQPVEPGGAATELHLMQVRGELRQAREAELQRTRLQERIENLSTTAAHRGARERDLQQAEQTYGQLESKVSVLEEGFDAAAAERLDHELLVAETAVRTARDRRDAAIADRAQLQARADRLAELAAQVAEHAQRRGLLQERAELLAFLERAYGRDGIPALIVSASALPQLETEACRILAELGTSYRVELRTERELKGGGTADALDVVVVTETGERPYETFSGGERTRINLALRIALARLLAHRRGADSRLLAIDEPEFLDEAGTAALAGVLQDLHRSGDFDRVLLISHVPALRDAFDMALTVVKDGDRSRVMAA